MAASPDTTGSRRRRPTFETPVRDRPANPNHPSNFCPKCLQLDLEKAFDDSATQVNDWKTWSQLDIKIADVGTYYRQPSVPSCHLCHLLRDSRLETKVLVDRPEDAQDTDELRAFSVSRHNPWVNSELDYEETRCLLEGDDARYLVIVPSGSVIRKYYLNSSIMIRRGFEQGFVIFRRRGSPPPNVFAPRTVEPNFDVSLGKTWLKFCTDHHTRLCSRITRKTQGLWLIDCHSSVVRLAPPEAKYVALSYVWGEQSTEEIPTQPGSEYSFGHMPPRTDLPAVIQDAMAVTIDMGFEYLWIDKFCIDQKNDKEKDAQIGQMDSIYHNAEFTIIAAAGSDPTYGLPGIGNRHRQPHHTLVIRDINIASTLRHPETAIQSSKWSTRGWTLQEAVLSRRRLVFTDDQVYFECNAMNCQESLSAPLERFHVKDKSKFRNVMRVGIFGRGNLDEEYGMFDEAKLSPARNLSRFTEIVRRYTARDLTEDEDSLRALCGIVREFETSQSRIFQIQGIPYLSSVPDKALNSFLDSMMWFHNSQSEEGQNRPKPRRRKDFPSWSWAGWAGKAHLVSSGSERRFLLKRVEVTSMSVITRTGTITAFSQYPQNPKVGERLDYSPLYLKFRAPIIPSSLFSCDTSLSPPILKLGRAEALLHLSTGPWDPQGFKRSLEEGEKRQCIYWGEWHGSDIVIVLQSENNNTWSRVGLIRLEERTYTHSLERLWSGVRRPSPQYDQWLKERPTGVFQVG